MLRSLHIRNYVLIDSLDVDFPEGLVIISGQTGAGKSILLGALSLLMGAKADAAVISEDAQSCTVEAEFESCSDEVASIASDNDLDVTSLPSGGISILIRRVVARSGRSRCFIGDAPVTVGLLTELVSRLIDIHSQNSSAMLSDKSFQLSLLDRYASDDELLRWCSRAWKSLSSLKREQEEVSQRLSRLNEQKSYVEAQHARLCAASLKEGEMEELEEEQKCLGNAEQIKSCLQEALSSLDNETLSVAAALKEASRQLLRASSFLPVAGSLSERLDSTRIELEDIRGELESVNEKMDADPSRLEAVEQRMSLLYDLMKVNSCATVEELIALRDRLGNEMLDSDTLSEHLEELSGKVRQAEAEFSRACEALTGARKKACPEFSRVILSSVRGLDLPQASFEVELTPCTPGAGGADSVCYLFSSTGRNLQDISKCASGGEMSRIMLCLKAMMARFVQMPTLIFDEIDTGVSGSTADKMGSMICSMGADMQVFAITHLPQVAAKGNAHYLVSKSTEGERTFSSITRLSDEERVMEIARMLSGSTITPEAISNARALL